MRMRREDLSQFAFFKTTQISHSIFIEMKISFLHDIPSCHMNGNHTATDLKSSTFYP